MDKKRRMTVDELLGPELTAELGIDRSARNRPVAAPVGAEEVEDGGAGADVAAADGLPGTVMDKPNLEKPEAVIKEPPRPVPAPVEPPGVKPDSRAARVPLPPPPGKRVSSGRIPTITPKGQAAALSTSEAETTDAGESMPNPTEAGSGGGAATGLGSADVAPFEPANADETPPAHAPVDETAKVEADDRTPPLEQPNKTVQSIAADEPRAATPVRFPQDEAKILWGALRAWLRGMPAPIRVAIFAIPLVAALAVVLGAVLLLAPGHERAFLVANHTMLAVPTVEETAYGTVGDIERNEEVLVLERVDNFALVRDPEGRAGWVQDNYLAEMVPPIGPDLEFTRCYRRLNEATVQPCQERARFQAERCMAHCEDLDNPTPCQVECQQHRTNCENRCALTLRELRAAALEREAAAHESASEPTGEPEVEPGPDPAAQTEAEVASGEEEEPAPRPKKKKRKKRKKRKKKKKR